MHLRIGDGYALFQGPVEHNTPHAHAAFQITVALGGELAMHDGVREHRGVALVVPPLARHRMVSDVDVRSFYVEADCTLAAELRARCGPAITVMPEMQELTEELAHAMSARTAPRLDARLQQAMTSLAERDEPLAQVARRTGLSPQRLRALAHEQLGMPLARWRIWKRLRVAASALGEGRSLAEAAAAAGFSDQAHFSRQMRAMFGTTPSQVLPFLRAQGRGARGRLAT